jgi:hypothetical protein
MPDPFGSSSQNNYIYSIFATYTKEGTGSSVLTASVPNLAGRQKEMYVSGPTAIYPMAIKITAKNEGHADLVRVTATAMPSVRQD